LPRAPTSSGFVYPLGAIGDGGWKFDRINYAV
jgi:hypothetical protein